MSQAGSLNNGGGGGGNVTTLTGDTGGPVPPTAGNINVKADVAANNSGATVSIDGTPGTSTLTLNVTDAQSNTFIGKGAGVSPLPFSFGSNIALGKNAMNAITTTVGSVAIGAQAMELSTTQIKSVAIGTLAMSDATTGQSHVCVGYNALAGQGSSGNVCIGKDTGTNFFGTESWNICLGHGVAGVVGDNNTTRIGTFCDPMNPTLGGINRVFVEGIAGVSVSNLHYVTIDSSTGQAGSSQLGSSATIPAQVISITPVNHAISPYNVLSTDQYLKVDTSDVVTLKFPNAPTTGRYWIIKDATGNAAAKNITVTTVGGAVNIDGATSYTIATNYEAITVIFDGTAYEVF